ncbi:FKBP-type peptidyl-prolyl cis-trans isomerase [Eikenella halliae]|uniref:FKBP-type peptidyl-prolyl cis-trans isomerase n=1 Tax=Eikenella halliae TaxID=1795832 RepID=UPI0028D4FB46|nr:FKBP-type peptidyl-prolyl cis-trans isomerase [Eikenella halliae]
MQTNTFRTGLLAAAVVFALAACNQQSVSGGASSPATSSPAAASAASGPAAASAPAAASDVLAGMTEQQKASYLIGYLQGRQLGEANAILDFDQATLVKGLQAGMASQPLPVSDEEANNILQQYHNAQMGKMATRQLEEGKAFLEANKSKEGVKTTPSGLQYSVKTEGTGKQPNAKSTVTVHYEGRLIDGTVFDSSIKRGEPVTFKLDGVIKGWTEGLQLMKEGGEYTLYIPAELAYGDKGNPSIPPNSVLVFDVKLIKVQ